MARDTVFDLSSLTKPLATTTAVMLLAREGKLRPDDRVTRFFPNFGVHGKFGVTFRHLLTHCSGLPAWRPFYKDVARGDAADGRTSSSSRGAREFVYEQIHRERLESAAGHAGRVQRPRLHAARRAGRAGHAVAARSLLPRAHLPPARAARHRLHRSRAARRDKLAPDHGRDRAHRALPVAAEGPVRRGPRRQRVGDGRRRRARGAVLDRRATSTCWRRWLRACARDEDPTLPGELVRHFWTRDGTVADSTWALGWDTPSARRSSAGSAGRPHAVGHLGFTGHVAVDRPRARRARRSCSPIACIPTRHNDRIREVRPRVHDAVWEALDA